MRPETKVALKIILHFRVKCEKTLPNLGTTVLEKLKKLRDQNI